MKHLDGWPSTTAPDLSTLISIWSGASEADRIRTRGIPGHLVSGVPPGCLPTFDAHLLTALHPRSSDPADPLQDLVPARLKLILVEASESAFQRGLQTPNIDRGSVKPVDKFAPLTRMTLPATPAIPSITRAVLNCLGSAGSCGAVGALGMGGNRAASRELLAVRLRDAMTFTSFSSCRRRARIRLTAPVQNEPRCQSRSANHFAEQSRQSSRPAYR